MDLLTIGDVSIDLYMKINENEVVEKSGSGNDAKLCFFHGSKIPVSHFETSIAGNSLNVGVACAKLGLKTGIYSELGDDGNADRITSELKSFGVDTTYCLRNNDTPTNLNSVVIFGGDRTIFSYHDKRTYKVQGWPEPKWIYYTSMGHGFEEFQRELIAYLGEHPKVGLAFNPGTLQMKAGVEKLRNILKVTDILFVNKEEAEALVGKEKGGKGGAFSLNDLYKKLHLLGVKLTVITDGENGAGASDGQAVVNISAYNDERPVVDRTGAGDAFSAGFLSAIIYGKGLKESLAWGVINGSCQIKEIGSIRGLLSKNEIEKIAKKVI